MEIFELYAIFSIASIRTVLTLDNPTHGDYLAHLRKTYTEIEDINQYGLLSDLNQFKSRDGKMMEI